jgi:hypothetical protein
VKERRHLATRLEAAFFDDESPQLDRFGLLLLTVIATLSVLALVDLAPERRAASSDIGGVVVTIFVGALLMLTVRASGVARPWRRVADVIALVAIVGGGAVLALDLRTGTEASPTTAGPAPIWLVVSILLPVVVVRRILHHRRVGIATLAGAISAYLLIAFAFAFAFLTMQRFGSTDFFGRAEPTTTFIYFSLASITTVGYGDVAAVTDLGRLLAVTEAALGQIFLVTLVAALVGLYVRRPRDQDA